MGEEEEEARGWICVDETAKRMLSRVLRDRAFLLLPPLHRVPLRAGNVVEITGPSPSAKTQILIQAAISCILPKEWNGIHYGGLGQLVLFLDLDCRFDVLRLAEMLKHRLLEANRLGGGAWWQLQDSNVRSCGSVEEKSNAVYDEELFVSCMKRFLFVRCYDSLEFLSTLKTLHYRIQREQEANGIQVGLLMIDSIGAFHWIDRLSSALALGEHNRKNLSLQSVVETIVQEMKKLLQAHPMTVIATKATIFGDKYPANEIQRKFSSGDELSGHAASKAQQFPFREFMPSSWQSFVTHKVLVRKSVDQSVLTGQQSSMSYSLEWLQPQLSSSDRIILKDVGVVTISS